MLLILLVEISLVSRDTWIGSSLVLLVTPFRIDLFHKDCLARIAFYVCSGDPNSGLSACIESTLAPEPSPQPFYSLLNDLYFSQLLIMILQIQIAGRNSLWYSELNSRCCYLGGELISLTLYRPHYELLPRSSFPGHCQLLVLYLIWLLQPSVSFFFFSFLVFQVFQDGFSVYR